MQLVAVAAVVADDVLERGAAGAAEPVERQHGVAGFEVETAHRRSGVDQEFIAALGKARKFARGPKPGRALRELARLRPASVAELSGVYGIGVAVMPSSLVPDDLLIITRRFELPPVGDVDFTLIRNPLANTEVIEALTQTIAGRTLKRPA